MPGSVVCLRESPDLHPSSVRLLGFGFTPKAGGENSGVSFFGAYCRSQHLFLEEETKFGNTLCITYYFLRQTRLQTCVFRPLDQRLDCIPFPTSVSRHTEQASFPPRWLPRFLRPATLEPATKPKGADPGAPERQKQAGRRPLERSDGGWTSESLSGHRDEVPLPCVQISL